MSQSFTRTIPHCPGTPASLLNDTNSPEDSRGVPKQGETQTRFTGEQTEEGVNRGPRGTKNEDEKEKDDVQKGYQRNSGWL